jgi:hypothetical protein
MYNVMMHLHADVSAYPWRWVMHWSRQLEHDLTQRRLEAQRDAARARRRRR